MPDIAVGFGAADSAMSIARTNRNMKLRDTWRRLAILPSCGARAILRVPARGPAADRTVILLTRARGGERAAFDELVHAWYPHCRRYAATLVHESSADDVVIEAFTDVWHALEVIRTPRQLQLCLAGAIARHAEDVAAPAGVSVGPVEA